MEDEFPLSWQLKESELFGGLCRESWSGTRLAQKGSSSPPANERSLFMRSVQQSWNNQSRYSDVPLELVRDYMCPPVLYELNEGGGGKVLHFVQVWLYQNNSIIFAFIYSIY